MDKGNDQTSLGTSSASCTDCEPSGGAGGRKPAAKPDDSTSSRKFATCANFSEPEWPEPFSSPTCFARGSAARDTDRSLNHTRWRCPSPPALTTSTNSSSLFVHAMRCLAMSANASSISNDAYATRKS